LPLPPLTRNEFHLRTMSHWRSVDIFADEEVMRRVGRCWLARLQSEPAARRGERWARRGSLTVGNLSKATPPENPSALGQFRLIAETRAHYARRCRCVLGAVACSMHIL
jgi:hypothetical protein